MPDVALPVIAPSQTFSVVTEQISSVPLQAKVPLLWYAAFCTGIFLIFIFTISVTYLFGKGVGIFGIEIPNAWGFAITNFVWWIGIGHAGTLISAFLLLLNQSWRNSINRFRRSHDYFRGGVRRHVSHCSTWGGRGCSTGSCLIPTR